MWLQAHQIKALTQRQRMSCPLSEWMSKPEKPDHAFLGAGLLAT